MFKKTLPITLLSLLTTFAQAEVVDEIPMDEDKPAALLLEETEKNPEDPTKVITKMGLGYDSNGDVMFHGSLGLDDTRKINLSINEDGSEWSAGGSWLFPKGIVNVYVNSDESRTGYNIGTYVPLQAFSIDTGSWMVFPAGGLSYTTPKDEFDSEGIKQQDSYGGYLGMFAILPFNDKWTLISWAFANAGSNDYYGANIGTGLSYRLTTAQSLNVKAAYSEDNYRKKSDVTITYTYEFN